MKLAKQTTYGSCIFRLSTKHIIRQVQVVWTSDEKFSSHGSKRLRRFVKMFLSQMAINVIRDIYESSSDDDDGDVGNVCILV